MRNAFARAKNLTTNTFKALDFAKVAKYANLKLEGVKLSVSIPPSYSEFSEGSFRRLATLASLARLKPSDALYAWISFGSG
jgi:hypothetical protein